MHYKNIEDIPKINMPVTEVAEVLGINLPRAYKLTRRGDFPAFRIGRRIIVHRKLFYQWVEKQATIEE